MWLPFFVHSLRLQCVTAISLGETVSISLPHAIMPHVILPHVFLPDVNTPLVVIPHVIHTARNENQTMT